MRRRSTGWCGRRIWSERALRRRSSCRAGCPMLLRRSRLSKAARAGLACRIEPVARGYGREPVEAPVPDIDPGARRQRSVAGAGVIPAGVIRGGGRDDRQDEPAIGRRIGGLRAAFLIGVEPEQASGGLVERDPVAPYPWTGGSVAGRGGDQRGIAGAVGIGDAPEPPRQARGAEPAALGGEAPGLRTDISPPQRAVDEQRFDCSPGPPGGDGTGREPVGIAVSADQALAPLRLARLRSFGSR